jgi:hypothetical protein
MSTIDQIEKKTQERAAKLFCGSLDYGYLARRL